MDRNLMISDIYAREILDSREIRRWRLKCWQRNGGWFGGGSLRRVHRKIRGVELRDGEKRYGEKAWNRLWKM